MRGLAALMDVVVLTAAAVGCTPPRKTRCTGTAGRMVRRCRTTVHDLVDSCKLHLPWSWFASVYKSME